MIDRNKVIALAISQVGYHEKLSPENLDSFTAPNDGNGNYTKYARDLDAMGYFNGPKQGYDWCAVFSDAMFAAAYGMQLAQSLLCEPPRSAGAGCVYAAQYFKNVGRFFKSPEIGDKIYFDYGDGINHTGIVVAATNAEVVTVEGNVNGQVQQCHYPLTANYIAGYGRPCWELYSEGEGSEAPVEPEPSTCQAELELPILQYGDFCWHVALLQVLLVAHGLSCGPCGADGDFGNDTRLALSQYQTANGITADCIVREDTWKKLLE